ncbi:MAG: PEP-CTERM sorting domain-containing protein [Phycisphaeraceae bacterium]|nr:PEP-CTERM sorting domain-containing protein [Phycisphaeraceae bacterium]
MNTNRTIKLLICIAWVLTSVNTVSAQTSWNVSGGGDWSSAGSWTSGVPSANTAIFDNEDTGTVTFSVAPPTVTDVSFRNDSGALTFDLGGNTLTMTATNGLRMGTLATHVNDVTFTNGTLSFLTGNNITWSVAGIQNNLLTFTGSTTYLSSISTSTSTIGTGAGAAGNILSVENGATISTRNNILIGQVSSTPGTNAINVTDATFIIDNGNRGVALQSGNLNITNSTVSVGYLGASTDAGALNNSGNVNFNSGSLSARYVRMTPGNTFYIGDGGAIAADFHMSYSAAYVNAPNGVHVRSNGSIAGIGTINGNITGDAGAGFAIAETAPTGAWPNIVNGNFDAGNFDLTFKLGDFPTELANDLGIPQPFDPPYDQLMVNGLFTHPTSITIDLTDYVAPQDQDYELKVLGWTSETGSHVAPTFYNGSDLTYEYKSDGLYLTAAMAAALHPGDANGDGLVNLSDLQILGDNWQSTTATWAEADFTGDNIVNLADLQILGDNWGFGVGPDVSFDQALAGVAIPEPTSLLLVGLGGLLVTRRCVA